MATAACWQPILRRRLETEGLTLKPSFPRYGAPRAASDLCHSMRIEKLSPHGRERFEGPDSGLSPKSLRMTGARSDPSGRANSSAGPDASHCSSGLPGEFGIPMKCLSPLAPERFSRIQTECGTGMRVSSKPSKNGGSVRFLRRAVF